MSGVVAIDSNVVVAAVVSDHPDHETSAALLISWSPRALAVTGHSFAEAFVTLTKHSRGGVIRWPPDRAIAALDAVAERTQLIGLSPAETLAAVRRYAESGGVGARLYDYLIGEAVQRTGIQTLITWNDRHFRSLFPRLTIQTPTEALR